MIYHDQNKDDNRMINDLYRAERELSARDEFERRHVRDMDFILPLRTPVDDGKKIPDFSNDLFEYGVNLSKEVLDSLIPTDAPICPDDQTGYQSYQDSPESDIEQARRQR